MPQSIQRKTRRHLGLLLAAPLLLNGILYWSIIQSRVTSERVFDTQRVIAKVEELSSNVKDAETGQRGYLITGDESYLVPYHSAQTAVQNTITQLRERTANNPVQREHLRELEPLIKHKLTELQYTVDLRRAQGFAAAAAVVGSHDGQRTMNQIRAVIAAMKSVAFTRLEQRLRAQRATGTRIGIVWTVVTAVIGLILVSLRRTLYRYSHERAEAESRLTALNDQLETAVRERTVELQRSNEHLRQQADELARSNADLERFAYAASHDLQEPLRNMTLYSQLLARRYRSKLDSDADTFLDFIANGAAAMTRLVSDLLSYSRIMQGDSEAGQADCEAALETARANCRDLVALTGATITSESLPTVRGNWPQLVQVFQHLLTNALTFRGQDEPRIHVAAEKVNGYWVFSVRDNGVGIAPEYHERIFIMFQRLDRKHGGSGVGLTLCKRIIARHGGQIWVQSELGKGAIFLFTLPIDSPAAHLERTA